MAIAHNFRSALNGFNREDVVKYIEFMNSRHTTEVNQLHGEIESLKSELVTQVVQAAPSQQLEQNFAATQARCQELEELCADLRRQLDHLTQQTPSVPSTEELEIYRRAERVERMAQERASQIRTQAGNILTQASESVHTAAQQITTLAGQVATDLDQLKQAVSHGEFLLAQTSAAISSISTDE